MSKPIVFNPDAQPVETLFAKWVKLYIAQAKLDDDEAEPLQQPLSDLEKAIDAQPLVTIRDFSCHLMASSCFGDFGDTHGPERRKEIYAAAMTEVDERESLLAAIEQHRAVYDRCERFSTDTGRVTDGDPEFEALSAREFELLNVVVEHPTTGISNIVLKGRYLAAVQNVGGLGFEQAQAFIGTLMEAK
jgi:hypothetical protein